jgi:sialate O-acetylesterase
MKTKLLAALLLSLLLWSGVNAQIKTSPIFSDNMVLQRESEVPVWGTAPANKKFKLQTSWDKKIYQIVATENGKWEVKVTTPIAGGPYTLSVLSDKKNSFVLRNILIGDVWICSGQSNMEMQISGNYGKVLNVDKVIKSSENPNIRFLTISRNAVDTLTENPVVFKNSWRECNPSTISDFSAVGYFFGKEINQSQNIPVGLISVSYGGTIAEAWTSPEAIKLYPPLAEKLKNIVAFKQKGEEQQKTYIKAFNEWSKKIDLVDIGTKQNWQTPGFNDSDWSTIKAPGVIEEQGFKDFNGLFWCRKEVSIPKSWIGRELTLSLGPVDDIDFTYFNGVQVGSKPGWNTPRKYIVPANLVKSTKVLIAVRVMDNGGDAGFRSNAEDLYLETTNKERVELTGDWKMNISLTEAEVPAAPVDVEAVRPNFPTLLYNGMIHPIIPYAMKGVIWYQGEANASEPNRYYDILPLLIQDWRTKWNKDFPFYYVQLANFKTLQTKPEDSAWPVVRDAQLNTLHLKNTGMAVAIDLGEADNIHPANKQEVGRRLALNARAKTYGENILYSGPIYDSYAIDGNKICISFKHTDGGLKIKEGDILKGFTIAGPDKNFYWANAEIVGDKVIVSCPEVAYPVAVRYAWAINPILNLYNGVGLPASPFRTDCW